MNVYLHLDTDAAVNEARRRICLVMGRHPEYTGKIIVSTKEGEVYFWDSVSFLEKKPRLAACRLPRA